MWYKQQWQQNKTKSETRENKGVSLVGNTELIFLPIRMQNIFVLLTSIRKRPAFILFN